MRLLQFLFLICGLAWMNAPALADQNDPRLSKLFAEIREVSSPTEAAPIEAHIWAIWLETSDQPAASLLQIGLDAMQANDYIAALQAFDRLVTIAPDFAEGWNKRATVHYLVGNLEQSLDDIAATIFLEPRHFGALSGRGLVYISLEDFGRALVSFEAALEVNPQMVGARINAEAIRRILGEEI
ncbi:MAG: tetratricopeptide repeat protein [Boseongicola sp.]